MTESCPHQGVIRHIAEPPGRPQARQGILYFPAKCAGVGPLKRPCPPGGAPNPSPGPTLYGAPRVQDAYLRAGGSSPTPEPRCATPASQKAIAASAAAKKPTDRYFTAPPIIGGDTSRCRPSRETGPAHPAPPGTEADFRPSCRKPRQDRRDGHILFAGEAARLCRFPISGPIVTR